MTGKQREQARRLIEDGCSLAETARTVGVDAKTVGRWFPDAPRMTPAEVAEWARYCKANITTLRGTQK